MLAFLQVALPHFGGAPIGETERHRDGDRFAVWPQGPDTTRAAGVLSAGGLRRQRIVPVTLLGREHLTNLRPRLVAKLSRARLSIRRGQAGLAQDATLFAILRENGIDAGGLSLRQTELTGESVARALTGWRRTSAGRRFLIRLACRRRRARGTAVNLARPETKRGVRNLQHVGLLGHDH